MTYYPLEKRQHLVDGYRKVFNINSESLLLLMHAGQAYLLEGLCPHAAWTMGDGRIIGDNLQCGMHGYLFSLRTGECTYFTEGPCRGLKTYPLVWRDDEVGVEL